ncbi:MAG: hypothetical protein ACF8PN_03885 [Phycisphaerales bacterium]
MIRNVTLGLGVAALAGAASAQTLSPVQSGDLALGLSRGTASETLQQVRGGALEGSWTALTFAQSTEFDNLDGPFSHSGNLLALNFGTTAGGGSLYNYATDGTDAGEVIYEFNTANGGVETTRVGGLSVSPDNTRVAAIGYDTGSLIILDYTPSNGTGSGAAITGATAHEFVLFNGTTQGTTWLDNDTVLVYAVGSIDSELLSVDADTGQVDVLASIAVRNLGGGFSDVEYNPNLSPYVYLLYSAFSGGTENTLTALDPGNGYSEVNQVTLDGSLNTGREIALGPNDELYLGAYGGSAAVGPIVDTIEADPALWTNDGSVDYYQAVGISSSFNGLDVAIGGGAVPTLIVDGICPGVMTFTAENMTPGGNVAFIYAFNTGSQTIPAGNPCAGTQLGLDRSARLGTTQRADASGVAVITPNVPAQACGNVFIQALDLSSCGTTNVVGL